MSTPAHDAARAGFAFGGLFRPPFAAVVNHLLRSASWARIRLAPHAGKIARFDVAPFAVTLAIRDGGDVEDSSLAASADASFKLTPSTVLRVLAADENAWRDVQVDGDTAFARDILHVAQNLRWDIEEDLSRVFGDIAAHRMVQAGNDFRRWQRNTAEHLARSAAAYWSEERPLIATRRDIERYVHEVDVLRDDVARAEKRLEKLLHGQARPNPASETSKSEPN
jgi:ubiquinone biosynthesis protein UbiJ